MTEVKSDSIIEDSALVPIGDATIIQIAETADQTLEAYQKVRQTALKITNPQDWIDQNGRPYLQSTGAEKIARLFGISWRFIGDPAKHDLAAQGHYRYDTKLEMIIEHLNVRVEVIGSRKSDDPFFTVYYKGKGENRKRFVKPGSEVDEADVMKASITNAIGNGITRILGLRNLTWDEVNNIDRSQVTGIAYDGKNVDAKKKQPTAQKPPTDSPKKTDQPEDAVTGNRDKACTKPQASAIHKMLAKLEITDEHEKLKKVSELAGREGVISDLISLSIKEASTVIKSLSAAIDEQNAAQRAAEQEEEF